MRGPDIARLLFHALLVRPFVWIVLGLNPRNRERLRCPGPAIIVANHNNHIDTLILMSLFPLRQLWRLRAAAADDYFFRNRALAWFAVLMFGIIPVKRSGLLRGDGAPLAACSAALDRGAILIVYPEGTRGEPERLAALKPGVCHLARDHPDIAVIPVFLHGTGKLLPKGKIVPVPFVCDVAVGRRLRWTGDRDDFMRRLEDRFTELARQVDPPAWL